jgi:hypothetical protein
MLAGTKLRSWRRRLEAARRKAATVFEEIDGSDSAELKRRLYDANCDMDECLGILGATIELCRDPRGQRPTKLE